MKTRTLCESSMTPHAIAYAQAHAELQAALLEHSALIESGASSVALLESRYAFERIKARLRAAHGVVTNAEWERLANAENLGRAVEVLLAGVLADARVAAECYTSENRTE
ncbi:MAG TPA: hypothetical protein VLC92_00330 [Rhodocyclaceae bacterium]|nr:hypothetical protein [Rhodocyclaceae bacterium]